jgi:hypothetical protein
MWQIWPEDVLLSRHEANSVSSCTCFKGNIDRWMNGSIRTVKPPSIVAMTDMITAQPFQPTEGVAEL